MTEITIQTVEALKAHEHFFAAGALALSLGLPRSYGCHFGMRSTRDRAIAEFNQGWDAASRR